MPLLEIDGAQIGYDTFGDPSKQPLLLLHGIYVSRAQWRRQALELSGNHRVITCDLRGHGESSGAGEGTSIVRLADDVAALLEGLDVGPVVCCGHSFGGLVAQELALRHPDRVKALVLAETIYGVVSTPWEAAITAVNALALRAVAPEQLLRFFAWFFGAISGEGVRRINSEAMRHLEDEESAMRILDASLHFDSRWRLHQIRCPTLLLVGQIPQIPLVSFQAFEMLWRIGRARFSVIPRAGHMVHWDNPAAFTEEVERFLSAVA